MSWHVAGLGGSALLLALLATGLPIAYALMAVGLLGITAIAGLSTATGALADVAVSSISNWILVAVPLFILMGHLAYEAGLTTGLYTTFQRWLGRIPGGLGIATMPAAASFAAVSGSSLATVATIGKAALPEMRRYGYDDRLSAGIIAAAGTVGILIPPSVALLIYAMLAQVSVGKMFLAGIVPGLLEVLVYSILLAWQVKRKPHLAPQAPSSSWPEKIHSLKALWPIALLFTIVVGGLYSGLFTATEAAAVGVFAALILFFIHRRLDRKILEQAIRGTVRESARILFLIAGASIFTRFMLLARVPQNLSRWAADAPLPPILILVLFLLLLGIMGMFLDGMSILLISVPLFLPVAQEFGWNLFWLGVLTVRMIEVGLITPPIGLNCYVVKGIAPDIPMNQIFRGVLMFLPRDLLIIALLVLFPPITLWLPNVGA